MMEAYSSMETTTANEARIGAHGQVAIPESARSATNLGAGDRPAARMVGEPLVLERRGEIARRLQDRFRHIPPEVSLVDELIAERRLEAAREAAED